MSISRENTFVIQSKETPSFVHLRSKYSVLDNSIYEIKGTKAPEAHQPLDAGLTEDSVYCPQSDNIRKSLFQPWDSTIEETPVIPCVQKQKGSSTRKIFNLSELSNTSFGVPSELCSFGQSYANSDAGQQALTESTASPRRITLFLPSGRIKVEGSPGSADSRSDSPSGEWESLDLIHDSTRCDDLDAKLLSVNPSRIPVRDDSIPVLEKMNLDERRGTFIISSSSKGMCQQMTTESNTSPRRLTFCLTTGRIKVDGRSGGVDGDSPSHSPSSEWESVDLSHESPRCDDAVQSVSVIPVNPSRIPVRVRNRIVVEKMNLDERRGTFIISSSKGLLQVVAEPQVNLRPMSFQADLLASKEPFTLAKFAKNLPFKNKRVFAPNKALLEKPKTVWRMGNSNLRRIPVRGALPIPPVPEDPYLKRSLQRRRNGQREVHKNIWRAEKRGLADAALPAGGDMGRPKIPKRATYKKARNHQPSERTAQIIPRGKEVKSSDSSDSPASTLPLRSDVLPPDGDSLRSTAERIGSPAAPCPSCADFRSRLSKAYAQKGAIGVALEKTQQELALAQKRVAGLEKELQEARKNHEEAECMIKDLENEMSQTQREKALFQHELSVARRNLAQAFEQLDASDCSHVSSVYVSGSQKTLDDGIGEEVSPDDEDYEESPQCRKMKQSLDYALDELERLKGIELHNEELQSRLRHYEEKVGQLQDLLQEANKFDGKDMATQTFRRDGTFTKQPDKTKIPKRLFGHHSSLPVISDPPNLCRLQSTTSSLSRLETLQKSLRIKENEIATLKNEMTELEKELERQKQQEAMLQDNEMSMLKAENERLHTELRVLTEKYRQELVMRKKYFNIAEDLKGKIRVFCRIKPTEERIMNSVLDVPDVYTVRLRTQRAKYEFTFDGVFSAEHSQEDVFSDVENVIQSALDGYNVCIFAYGQTGSGKTYTLAGNESNPGIGPRAFQKIFDLVRENSAEMNFHVRASVLELYNDKLIDLLKDVDEDQLKIRKDQYGVVCVQGSEIREVQNEDEMLQMFQEVCRNRHTGSTRMNPQSSRSHLIVTIFIESTNRITGTILRGKLNIVDLAGSERAGKSAVAANQMKEANSINKSLSALGDVIAALTSEQSHVPYRNNKLTMLMQDCLGNNAKTLMFVTISSSEHNVEESLNSLTYASRVKQIKNSATRISESKEIARLRSVITKLSKGLSLSS